MFRSLYVAKKRRNTFLNQQRAVDIQKSFSDAAREGTLRIFFTCQLWLHLQALDSRELCTEILKSRFLSLTLK